MRLHYLILLILMQAACVQNQLHAGEPKRILLYEYGISSGDDITETVNNVISSLNNQSAVIVFPKGRYHFFATKAISKFHYITNHDNGTKNIAFNLSGLKNITIDGMGSEFIFHGEIIPFLIEYSTNVKLMNFSIDWEIPFYIQGEVLSTNAKEGWFTLKMYDEGFSYECQNGQIGFPVAENVTTFWNPGESIAFDKKTKSPVYGANKYDYHGERPVKVTTMPDKSLKFTQKLKDYPPLNSVFIMKGHMGTNRYGPAFHAIDSKNIELYNINIYHAPGMGFLGERSENMILRKTNIKLRAGTNRYISTTADATHFANCKGSILMDNCLFENMLDDGTNVHGTYMEIDSVIDSKRFVASLKHFQQAGFVFAKPGEKIWILSAPDPTRSNLNTLTDVRKISDTLYELTVQRKLAGNIKKGDLVENKTFNPHTFVVQNCTIRNHRARNIVLKTPGKIEIRNNYFQSMMASILIRGEAMQWYESGAVDNVMIENNHFENCTLGGGSQSILFISPRLNSRFDPTILFDKNIVFRNNTINTFHYNIVDADRVENLTITGNTILLNKNYPPFNNKKQAFVTKKCQNVVIKENSITE
ncbi:MAG: right-handed parallel beta-helix repeat-containing protein [Paludibacter sp.]|nr:right-handed parallel beta-helix repeat-containing protein [Paludibacter sp.]